MVSTPAWDEGQEGEAETDGDHPLMEGGVGQEAQAEQGKEPDHEGHRRAVDRAEDRGGHAEPISEVGTAGAGQIVADG